MQFGQDFEKIFFRLSLEKVKYLQAIKTGFYTSEEIDALSFLANKFYHKFNETPTKEQLALLVQNHPKSKERVSESILNMIFDYKSIIILIIYNSIKYKSKLNLWNYQFSNNIELIIFFKSSVLFPIILKS